MQRDPAVEVHEPGVDDLGVREVLPPHAGVDAVGADQQAAPRGGPVGEMRGHAVFVGLVVRESLAVGDFLAVQQDLPQGEAVDVEVGALVFQAREQPQPLVVDVRVRQRPARGGAEEFVQLGTATPRATPRRRHR